MRIGRKKKEEEGGGRSLKILNVPSPGKPTDNKNEQADDKKKKTDHVALSFLHS